MEIAAISAALASVKHASDIAKLIKDSEFSLEAADTRLKLAELIDKLAAANIKIANFNEVLSERDAEIQRLKGELEIHGSILWEAPSYFLKKENGEKDGPYCQLCQDNDKKLIRLQPAEEKGEWRCTKCQNSYKDSSYKKKERAPYYPRAPL